MSDKDKDLPFDRPLVELTISAPVDEVWRALRDPAAIHQWFGWDADTLEREIEVIFHEYATASDAEHVLAFRGMQDRLELEAAGAETIVRIVRPAPTAETDWDDIFEDETQGWIAFVNQLKFALERHRDDRRRTLYFAGSPKQPGVPSTAVRLGLPASGVDAAYAIEAPTGDSLAGKVWHRGRHQIGVTVEGWGDGLLVVIDRAPSDAGPGSSQVILTTYGLSEEGFAALRDRWTKWWDEHYGPSAYQACS